MRNMLSMSVCCVVALLQTLHANAAKSAVLDAAESMTIVPGSLPPTPPTPVVADYYLERLAPSHWRCMLQSVHGEEFDLVIGLGRPSQKFESERGLSKSVPMAIRSLAMGQFVGEGLASWWGRAGGSTPSAFDYNFHINAPDAIYEFNLSNFDIGGEERGAIIVNWTDQAPTAYRSSLKPYAVGFCDREAAQDIEATQ